MPRVSEIGSPGESEILQREFAAERKLFGDLLNPTRVLAHCPPILEAAKKFYGSFEESGLLPGSLLALVYARVATLNGCPF
jgi:alkylhydroperoxidase family enzyme